LGDAVGTVTGVGEGCWDGVGTAIGVGEGWGDGVAGASETTVVAAAVVCAVG